MSFIYFSNYQERLQLYSLHRCKEDYPIDGRIDERSHEKTYYLLLQLQLADTSSRLYVVFNKSYLLPNNCCIVSMSSMYCEVKEEIGTL